jgi:exodeoxyribonuclease V alpha subunit
MHLHENQHAAVDAAERLGLTIICGGAGTGKTTVIKAIQQRLSGGGITTMAFAGKAAARLREVTGQQASTIHSALGWRGDCFTLGSLKHQSVIVDEASMVPSTLLYEIIKRSPKRLILVGDEAQVQPVGAGQPFHDLISLCPDRVTQLTHCFRSQEAVFRAATAIREAGQLSWSETSENEHWAIHATGNPERTHAAVLEMVRSGQVDFDQDIILCPRNGDVEMPATIKSLNAGIRQIVNPRAVGRIAAGDRVINTKNQSDLDIWNGTTGTVSAASENRTWIDLDLPRRDSNGELTTTVDLGKEESRRLELAYALTVHKAQGSQYRRVIFVCLDRDCRSILDRSLLYTAVTRTQAACLVLGQPSAIQRAISTIKQRSTVLQILGGAR